MNECMSLCPVPTALKPALSTALGTQDVLIAVMIVMVNAQVWEGMVPRLPQPSPPAVTDPGSVIGGLACYLWTTPIRKFFQSRVYFMPCTVTE